MEGPIIKRRRGRPRKVEPVEAPIDDLIEPVRKGGVLPLWERRKRILEETKTTPRDFLEGTPWLVEFKHRETARHVRLRWMSDGLWKKHPVLPGHRLDIWEPVTEKIGEELGLRVFSKELTPEGIYKVSPDAFLMWCPEEIAAEQDAVQRELMDVKKLFQKGKKRIKEKFRGRNTGHIGNVTVSSDPEEIAEAEAREREELGEPLLTD